MHNPRLGVTSVQFSSVQSLSPVWFFGTSRTAAHQLQELAQTHVHWVRDAIQSSHPLSFLSLAFNLSRIRVFSNESVLLIRWPKYWVLASASVLPMNIQDWFPLGLTDWISLLSKGLSKVFSNTTLQKHQFFGTQLSLWSNSHIHTWLLEKP